MSSLGPYVEVPYLENLVKAVEERTNAAKISQRRTGRGEDDGAETAPTTAPPASTDFRQEDDMTAPRQCSGKPTRAGRQGSRVSEDGVAQPNLPANAPEKNRAVQPGGRYAGRGPTE